jgi:adenylate cyclase
VEIERKFLVKGLPLSKLEGRDFSPIEQYYLKNSTGVRIRREGKKYTLTIKGEGLRERTEVEKEISEKEFEELIALCDRGLKKRRYYLGRWEIDVFEGNLEGLILAEIELSKKDEPLPDFPFPEVNLIEVTDNPEYLNENLSRGNFPRREL